MTSGKLILFFNQQEVHFPPIVLPVGKYIVSQSAIEIQYANQMALNDWEILPARTPLSISILVFMPANHLHCQDADNQLKALIDAAKGIVFPSDMWIDEIFFTRHTDILSEFKVQFAVWIKEKE